MNFLFIIFIFVLVGSVIMHAERSLMTVIHEFEDTLINKENLERKNIIVESKSVPVKYKPLDSWSNQKIKQNNAKNSLKKQLGLF